MSFVGGKLTFKDGDVLGAKGGSKKKKKGKSKKLSAGELALIDSGADDTKVTMCLHV